MRLYANVNWPRLAFLNLAFLPLVATSRVIAEYNVAQGVLPPGLDQRPLAAIASINCLAFSGSFDAANTWAAARALILFHLPLGEDCAFLADAVFAPVERLAPFGAGFLLHFLFDIVRLLRLRIWWTSPTDAFQDSTVTSRGPEIQSIRLAEIWEYPLGAWMPACEGNVLMQRHGAMSTVTSQAYRESLPGELIRPEWGDAEAARERKARTPP